MKLGRCTYVHCSLPQCRSGAQCSSFEWCVSQAELLEIIAQSNQYEQNYSWTKLSTSKLISTPSPGMKLDQCSVNVNCTLPRHQSRKISCSVERCMAQEELLKKKISIGAEIIKF